MIQRISALAVPTLIVGLGTALSPATAAAAGSLDLTIEVPRQASAESHRPYVAIWIEGQDVPARTLAVWYDAKSREGGGRDWLADMRQWWRKTGRTMSFPVDGISSATRPVGPQTLSFSADNPALANLPPGTYQLGVDAAREKGGEETVKVAFQWPPKAPTTTTGKGSTELGAISVSVKP